MIEWGQGVEGMDRERIVWDEPVATLIRCQAAYIERQGQTVDWDPDRTDRIIEAYEKRMKEARDAGNPTG